MDSAEVGRVFDIYSFLVVYFSNLTSWVNLITAHICGKVMFSAVSVCSGYNFECLELGTSFLVYRCIFMISRSSLSIKVVRSGSRSQKLKMCLSRF